MKPETQINYTLSLSDTLIIKGVAICFMLWHHLFYEYSEYGEWVQNIAHLGKVCVAMFLFVSAYGLTIQYSKIDSKKYQVPSFINTLKFQGKRLLKLYINYWFVFVLFVPMGVFLYHRSLQIPYGEQVSYLKSIIVDLFGMQGNQSYNITWWFYQLIIILYLIFPLLFIAIKRMNFIILIFCFLILGYHRYTIPIVHNWLFPFLLGISCALNRETISTFLNRANWKILFICNLFLLLLVAFLRLEDWRFGGIGMDGFFTITLIVFIVITVRKVKKIIPVVEFLGKHSMNIFLIHTFIFAYFYSGFIYSFKYPILIFIVLISWSLCISILIEYTKKTIGVYRIEKKIIDVYLTTKNS
jgi:peptidoglycan/LPS O-acetylase OafA/YrhL